MTYNVSSGTLSLYTTTVGWSNYIIVHSIKCLAHVSHILALCMVIEVSYELCNMFN